MAEQPTISLTVLRFIEGDNVAASSFPRLGPSGSSSSSIPINVAQDDNIEWQLDDEFINEFRLHTIGDESVVYTEKVANNSEDTVAAIRTMEQFHDVYVVGRGHNKETPLTAGLGDWSEYPELGAIGDLLVSVDFGVKKSVLVVQQYVINQVAGGSPEVAVENDIPRQSVQNYLTKAAHKTQPNFVHTEWNGAA